MKYHVNLHIVFCPKFRRKVLDGEVGVRFKSIAGEVAREKWGGCLEQLA